MKTFFQLAIRFVIGGAVGYTFMYVYLNDILILPDLYEFAFPTALLLTAILIGLMIWWSVRYRTIRKVIQQPLTGEEEDEAEGVMYRAYSDNSLATTLMLFICLGLMSLTLLTEQSFWFLSVSLITLLVSFIMSHLTQRQLYIMYPERNLPKTSDPDYAQRLLDVSDDGEKHVILQGLYKTNISTMSLFLVAIIVLLLYSMVTGNSQLFAIFIVICIMAFTNIQYIRIVRAKN
ncbi:DUF3169 family protein [Exiguobacterium profundum]|uniref:DUF3169 family protein n=1 Tax=Exiguobacterium profundum TaxID=307643 RepID=UPI0029C3F1E7|nr:DUF3169 family protein [Exiguobacterium profundum]MDX5980699.1 DUF3169 family protein [Exiguobacterium profundum]